MVFPEGIHGEIREIWPKSAVHKNYKKKLYGQSRGEMRGSVMTKNDST